MRTLRSGSYSIRWDAEAGLRCPNCPTHLHTFVDGVPDEEIAVGNINNETCIANKQKRKDAGFDGEDPCGLIIAEYRLEIIAQAGRKAVRNIAYIKLPHPDGSEALIQMEQEDTGSEVNITA